MKDVSHGQLVVTISQTSKFARLLELNPLNAELNHICHPPALLVAHHILHVSKIRVNLPIVQPVVETAKL
jgi:hypothetical protein